MEVMGSALEVKIYKQTEASPQKEVQVLNLISFPL